MASSVDSLVVIASDSFKGTLSSREVADVVREERGRCLPGSRICPVLIADGGEGTLEAIEHARKGRRLHQQVCGPLGDDVLASLLMLEDHVAVVEMAEASGLTLVPAKCRDPRQTTSRGTGELIHIALDHGARRILVGLGGSATNDAGMGAMRALGVRFLDEGGEELPGRGSSLGLVRTIDASGIDPRLAGTEVIALADVDAPLVGPRGATRVFAPQKGADAACVEELERGMCSYARVLDAWAQGHGAPAPSVRPGAGAAGGMGSALMAFLGAGMRGGIGFVLDAAGINELLAHASLCITGEGKLDSQTLGGKAVAGVAARCAVANVPCVAIAGMVEPGFDVTAAGLSAAIGCLAPEEVAKMGNDELARGARGRLRKAVRDNAELLVGLWDGGMHER